MHAPRAGAAHPPGRPRPAPRPRPPVHGVRSFGTHRCVYYGRSVAPPARPHTAASRPYKCTHERTCTDRQPPDPRLIGWWREGGTRFPVCVLPQFVAKRGSRAAPAPVRARFSVVPALNAHLTAGPRHCRDWRCTSRRRFLRPCSTQRGATPSGGKQILPGGPVAPVAA